MATNGIYRIQPECRSVSDDHKHELETYVRSDGYSCCRYQGTFLFRNHLFSRLDQCCEESNDDGEHWYVDYRDGEYIRPLMKLPTENAF